MAMGEILVILFTFFCNGYTFPLPDFYKADIYLKWYDTSISDEPDPFQEKVIFEDMIHGERSVDASDESY